MLKAWFIPSKLRLQEILLSFIYKHVKISKVHIYLKIISIIETKNVKPFFWNTLWRFRLTSEMQGITIKLHFAQYVYFLQV